MSQKRLCLAGHSYWWPSAKWQHEKCVLLFPLRVSIWLVDVKPGVANTVSNKAQRANAGVSNAERVKRWRAKGPNRDAYNAQQRERMRARREAVRAAKRVSGAAP